MGGGSSVNLFVVKRTSFEVATANVEIATDWASVTFGACFSVRVEDYTEVFTAFDFPFWIHTRVLLPGTTVSVSVATLV